MSSLLLASRPSFPLLLLPLQRPNRQLTVLLSNCFKRTPNTRGFESYYMSSEEGIRYSELVLKNNRDTIHATSELTRTRDRRIL